jgi:TolA-binding protein
MSAITDKTPVRLDLKTIVIVALAVAGAGGTWAMQRADVASLRADGESARREMRELRNKSTSQDAGLAEMRQDVRAMQEALKFQTQILQEIREEQRDARRRGR